MTDSPIAASGTNTSIVLSRIVISMTTSSPRRTSSSARGSEHPQCRIFRQHRECLKDHLSCSHSMGGLSASETIVPQVGAQALAEPPAPVIEHSVPTGCSLDHHSHGWSNPLLRFPGHHRRAAADLLADPPGRPMTRVLLPEGSNVLRPGQSGPCLSGKRGRGCPGVVEGTLPGKLKATAGRGTTAERIKSGRFEIDSS